MSPGADSSDRGAAARNLVAWGPLAFAAMVGLVQSRLGLYPFDEGTVLYGASSLVAGEHVYDHVRVNFTPGVLWLVAGMFRVLGTNVLWPRLFMAALLVALVAVCRSCLRLAGAGRVADVTALALPGLQVFLHPHWLMVSYTPCAVFGYLLALRFVLEPRPRFFLAGVAAGATVCFKQNVGALAVFMLIAALLLAGRRRPSRSLAGVALGTALPVVAMMAAVAGSGSLGGFLRDTVGGNLAFGGQWFIPYPAFLSKGAIVKDTFFYVPARVFALMFYDAALRVWLWRSGLLAVLVRAVYLVPVVAPVWLLATARGAERYQRRLLAIGALLLLLTAWPLATILHWTTASLGSLLCVAALASSSRRLAWAYLVAVVVLSSLGLWLLGDASRRESVAVVTPVGVFHTDGGNARRFGSVVHELDRRLVPGAAMFVVPYAPLYYFASGHPNAIEEDYLLPPWTGPERMAAIVRELDLREVPLIVWSRAELPRFERFASYGAPLARAIRERYRLAFVSDGPAPHDEIWVRRDGSSPRSGPLAR